MNDTIPIVIVLFVFVGCRDGAFSQNEKTDPISTDTVASLEIVPPSIENPAAGYFKNQSDYLVDGLDFPVGKPNAKDYYNAQGFGKNKHLGDDWNGMGGGNSDLGDPIFSIANGYVTFAEDIGGGWGNVIRVLHQFPDGQVFESLYAHCDSILVDTGTWIKKGQQIGTIGTAHGQYYAHLHLEIRTDTDLPIGGGYSVDQTGYADPTLFIQANRVVKQSN